MSYDAWKTRSPDDDLPDSPEQWYVCDACDGEGFIPRRIDVYEPGCGFSHSDVDEVPCEKCGACGGYVDGIDPADGEELHK